MSNSKIAVIGDRDSVLGFKALGIEVYTPEKEIDIRKTIHRLAANNYGVLFITEELANKSKDTIARFDEQFIPAIIPIPSNQGTLNIGMDRSDENVEKAIGVNLF